MKTAIFTLTRGYPGRIEKYSTLISRNISIYDSINKFRKYPAKMLIFHEGNITKEHQNFISERSPEKLEFIDISSLFQPTNLRLEDTDRFNLGYRYMCKFNMFHIWSYVKEYDYVMRVDEDIKINSLNPNIFELMKKKNYLFTTGRFSKESHELTNNTLPLFLTNELGLNMNKVYNHRFPYTSMYATKVSFWQNQNNLNTLKSIATNENQLIKRWGDLPVLGIILNLNNVNIKLFNHSSYNHISHNKKIKNNFLRNISINSKYNPIG